ncbi:MAG: M13 family metallopeptidase [Candidatus Saccharibacteria bacterium]
MTIFDKKLRPQDDFFGYVNNNWLKENPIPPNESVWGTFYVLREKSAKAINEIIDKISHTPDDDLTRDQKLIKTFFSTAMSFSDHKKNHLETLGIELQKIRDITDKSQLSYYLGYAHRHDSMSFWSDYVSVDDENSQIQVLRIHQSGLCMPNRDYYLDNTARMKHIRKEYETYFHAVHNLTPEHSPSTWDAVFSIESKLAKSSWTDVKLRDIKKNYTRFTIQELQSRFPRFNWSEYFKGLGWNNPNDNIVVDQPPFIDTVLDIIDKYSLDEIKEYLSWHTLNSLFGWIDEAAAKIRFNFYGKIIGGKLENNPLWKRIILQADDLIIGEALGREYATHYFPESSKKAIIEMVEDVRSAYHERINKVTWMGDSTKKRAHKKLDNIRVLIGYPSVWLNLDKLEFYDNNHLKNILSARSFETDVELAKIGQKTPREDWQMNAHTVNAYNDPNQLVICFPAAILQAPFYNPDASYATNLGGIGAVIGHEFTHGFDDQGAEFDEQGNAVKWQTKAEQKAFKTIADNMVKQANNYEVLPGMFLKGELVLGEAIADIGGLELAVETLRAKTNINDTPSALRELFINSAISERGSQRDEHLLQQVKTDPHPPSRFRINCVVPHVDAFYEAYGVTPSDKLYLPPEERVHIW